MSLQLVCMWHAVILDNYNHNNNSPPNEPQDAYQRFTDPGVCQKKDVPKTCQKKSVLILLLRKKVNFSWPHTPP